MTLAPTAPAARRPIVLLLAGAALGALAAAAGLSGQAGDRLPAGAVALVNGEVIREADYARALAAITADTRGALRADDRRRVLDRLIDEELLVQRGLALGLARHDRRVRADLTQTVLEGVLAPLEAEEPSPAELAAFYDTHRDLFAGPGRVHVRQVFVRVTVPDDPAAQARATEAAQRLRAGEPIAALQQALGDTPLSPLPDMLLPPAKLRDYLGPTALRTALLLGEGEVSNPIRSGTGYHVLQLVERESDRVPPLDEIRPQALQEWRRRQGEAALRAYLDELRTASTVVVAEPPP